VKFLVKERILPTHIHPRVSSGSMDRRAAREPLRLKVRASRRRRKVQAPGPRWPERHDRRVPEQRVRSEAVRIFGYLVIWLFGYLVISVWAISETSCFVYRVGKTDAGAVGSVKSAPVSDIVTEATVRVTP
jgi:hypothetical protein